MKAIYSTLGERPAKTSRHGVSIVLLGLLNVFASAVLAESSMENGRPPEAALFGFVEPDQNLVSLYWETHNWPLWLQGYCLKVRQGKEGAWQDLHPNPIVPNFHPERDWSNQGLTDADISALLEARAATFGTRIPDRSSDEVLSLLRNNDGLQAGDRLSQKRDFNIALFSGFGFVDHLPGTATEPLKAREYGLFAVDSAGITAESPVSTWEAQLLPPGDGSPVRVQQHVWDGIVVLQWRYSKEMAKARALFGFNVYRLNRETGEWIPLVNNPIGSTDEDADSLQFNFYDNAGNATVDQTYAIVGRNMFQEDFGRMELSFVAERFQPLPLPEVIRHLVVDEADLQIDWNYAEESAKRVKGFYVERAHDGDFERISGLLPPNTRSFKDSGAKEYSQVYDYRVVAVDKWDVQWTGPRIVLLYLGQSRPPQPQNLSGTFLVQKGQPGILLQWDLPSAKDRRTDSFRILSDVTEPGNLRLQAQIRPFKGNRFFYPLTVNGGRPVRMGLLPITEEGITGEPATVDVYMPTLQLPPVTGVIASFDPNSYSVELKWDYDESQNDLTGFRILMDGQSVPGMLDLPPDTRSIAFSDDSFEKGQTRRFSVLALGGVETTSPSLETAVWIRSDRLPEGVEPPADLRVVLVEKPEGPPEAELSWETVENLEEAGILGYALMVDYAQEGNVRRLNSLPPLTGPQFKYKLPELANRTHFTFRLAAITKENTLGPSAEAVLQLTGTQTESTPDNPNP